MGTPELTTTKKHFYNIRDGFRSDYRERRRERRFLYILR